MDGKFNLAGLSAGTYRIEIPSWGGGQSRGYVLDAVPPVAAGTQDLRLTAGKGLTIGGVVLDEAGHGVAGGWVTASTKSGGGFSGQIKGDGTFEIAGVAPGRTYALLAQAKSYVNTQVEDVAAGARDVRIVLARGLEASGTLCDAQGNAMANANVMFAAADGKHSQWTQTDSEGRFTVGGLTEGPQEAKVYVQKADGSGEWKAAGTLKGGDVNAALKLQ